MWHQAHIMESTHECSTMNNAVASSGFWRFDTHVAGFPMSSTRRRRITATGLPRLLPLMAGHGRCISTAMMLGDRIRNGSLPGHLDDRQLRGVAARLFGYFDDTRAPVPVGMRA
jgi:hypothetical protein